MLALFGIEGLFKSTFSLFLFWVFWDIGGSRQWRYGLIDLLVDVYAFIVFNTRR